MTTLTGAVAVVVSPRSDTKDSVGEGGAPCGGVELTFSIFIIDLFGLAGTHVDMYPYSVANIAASNVDKIKVMATVSYLVHPKMSPFSTRALI